MLQRGRGTLSAGVGYAADSARGLSTRLRNRHLYEPWWTVSRKQEESEDRSLMNSRKLGSTGRSLATARELAHSCVRDDASVVCDVYIGSFGVPPATRYSYASRGRRKPLARHRA